MGVAIRDTEHHLALQLTWEDPDELSDQLSPHNWCIILQGVYWDEHEHTI